MRRLGPLLLAALLAVCGCGRQATTRPQTPAPAPWGASVRGIRCALRTVEVRTEATHFVAVVQNMTDHPISWIRPEHFSPLVNGNIRIEIVDAENRVLDFYWPESMVVIPVRLHTVTLAPGEARELAATVSNGWNVEQHEGQLWPIPGRYRATAKFTAPRLAEFQAFGGGDMPFVANGEVQELLSTGLQFWTGLARSNTLDFVVKAR